MCRVPVFLCSGCGELVRHRFQAPVYCNVQSCTKSNETNKGMKAQPCQLACSPLRCGIFVTFELQCYECSAQVETKTVDFYLAEAKATTTDAETSTATREEIFGPARQEESLSSQQLGLAVDRLVSFSKLQLGFEEELRTEISMDMFGPNKWIQLQWFLDCTQFWEDRDDYKAKFVKHTLLSHLLEDSDNSGDSDDSEYSEEKDSEKQVPEGLALWVQKMESLKAYLAPEFRLVNVALSSNLNDVRATVTTALAPAGTS